MKPEIQLNNSIPEQLPTNNRLNVEFNSKLNQESAINNGAERYEQKSELDAVISDVGITTTLPAPVKNDNTVTNNIPIVNNTSLSSSPTIANDDDLIEKEWVDKAKKIVSETRSDPYKQEEEVSKLQIDYLEKRYGRKIGAA